MTMNTIESLRESLNRSDLSGLSDMLRTLVFGDVLRALPVQLFGVVPSVSGAVPQQPTGLLTIVLPEDAKAASVLRCTVRKGANSKTGEYAIAAYAAGSHPATKEVSVAPNGDIVFYSTDAVTQVDVLYVPVKGSVKGQCANSVLGVTSLTLQVASTGFAALPAAFSGKALLLMQANIVSGTNTGECVVVAPTTSVTTTSLNAALSVDGTGIWLDHTDDAPTRVTVDVLVYNTVDVNALLEAASSDI
jgi:hypothetical protein